MWLATATLLFPLNHIHGKRMKWLTNRKKRMEMIRGIQPTSKATLKMQCLIATKCDIDEARKLYNFFAEDISSLPDYDPAPTTWVDTTKQTAGDLFSWLKDNQNTIATGYEIVRQMTGGKLPPLTLPTDDMAASSGGETILPPINGE